MISRQYLLRKYRISYDTFSKMIDQLPDKSKKQLNLKANQFCFKPYQVAILVNFFGDYETGQFILKRKFARMYGCNLRSFKKILIDEFGPNSKLLSKRKFFSPNEQQQIIKKIGMY